MAHLKRLEGDTGGFQVDHRYTRSRQTATRALLGGPDDEYGVPPMLVMAPLV